MRQRSARKKTARREPPHRDVLGLRSIAKEMTRRAGQLLRQRFAEAHARGLAEGHADALRLLKRYGAHDMERCTGPEKPCRCGLDDAIAALAVRKPQLRAGR
jgi:hypothetical protein